MPRLGRGDQDLGPDEEEYYNPGRRRGVGCFFADDPTIAVTPVAAATTTTTAVRRRPFFGRTSTTRRRDDVGRKGGASVGGGQSAACARDGWCSAPRTAALLRTVQRGDYGTLTKLLSRSNRCLCCVLKRCLTRCLGLHLPLISAYQGILYTRTHSSSMLPGIYYDELQYRVLLQNNQRLSRVLGIILAAGC